MKRPCQDDCEESGVMWQRPRHSESYSMVLSVQMIGGTSFEVTVDPWTNIQEVKCMVNQLKGFPLAMQTMSIGGVMCENHRQISMYTNTRHTVVDLVLGSGTSSSSGSGGGEAAAAAAPAVVEADADEDDGVDSEAEANTALLNLLHAQRRAREEAEQTDEEGESELEAALEEALATENEESLGEDDDEALESENEDSHGDDDDDDDDNGGEVVENNE